MNKQELSEVVAKTLQLTKKDADKAVTVIFEEIEKALVDGDIIKITGFGTFCVKERKERVGTIPGTDKKITIPATKTVTFKSSKTLKEAIK